MEGWVSIHRSFLDWEWWGNALMVKLWIYCLLSANTKDASWKGSVIPRGSFVTSQLHIADILNCSPRYVYTMLRRLKASECIEYHTSNRFTFIKVVNYDTYQVNDVNQTKNAVHGKRTKKSEQSSEQSSAISPNKKESLNNSTSNNCGTNSESEVRTEFRTEFQSKSEQSSDDIINKEIYKEIVDGGDMRARERDFENFKILEDDSKRQSTENHSEVGGVARAGERISVTNVAEWLRENGGQQWKEIACMQLGLTTQQLELAFDEFQRELIAQGVEDHDERSLRSHFTNLIRKKIEYNKKQKRYNGQTSNRIESFDDLREAVETGWRMGEAERNQRGA